MMIKKLNKNKKWIQLLKKKIIHFVNVETGHRLQYLSQYFLLTLAISIGDKRLPFNTIWTFLMIVIKCSKQTQKFFKKREKKKREKFLEVIVIIGWGIKHKFKFDWTCVNHIYTHNSDTLGLN